MNGHVDDTGRALITVAVRPTRNAAAHDIEAWIDTGFNGDLVLPRATIEALALSHSGTVKAILADGSQVALKTYTCWVEWLHDVRRLEVVANDGEYPLLGVGLLWGLDVHISYRTGNIELK